jgi:hypothetical protein
VNGNTVYIRVSVGNQPGNMPKSREQRCVPFLFPKRMSFGVMPRKNKKKKSDDQQKVKEILGPFMYRRDNEQLAKRAKGLRQHRLQGLRQHRGDGIVRTRSRTVAIIVSIVCEGLMSLREINLRV